MISENSKLSKHVHVMDNFQYAINIGYDLYSDDKIKNYIPTESAIDIIEDIVLSTSPSSTDRARIFIGPYGKGKSHLALVILSILCRNDKNLYSSLLTTICQTRPELCEYIKNYHKKQRKLLPVVIQGSGMGIRQSLLFGLRKALESVDLGNYMPSTYFRAAIQTIDFWKKNYPDTYENFSSSISCSVSDFIEELSSFNNKIYEEFLAIYPTLTSGSEFNPVNGMDVVSLYSEVSKKIKENGYDGIFVIYDEFSKYLEGNIKKITGDEIKTLQDFAEYCNRSKNNQIHILLISHKNILNYIDNLSKTKIDAWKAVSNRFKNIELNTSTSQTYDLITKVINHDEDWFEEYKNKYSLEFSKLSTRWKNHKIFSDITSDSFNALLYKCYPLSPVTTFILPRISEEIAQNERTLFTFLSSSGQKNTLPAYLDNTEDTEFSLVTPDLIFDYFEPLFKAEAYDKPIHKYWKLAKVAIKKLNANQVVEKKIIKTLALIYIVNRFDLLSPDMNTIFNIFDGVCEISKPITELQSNNIIRSLDNSNYLRIVEHTDVNLNVLIENETEKVRIKYSVVDILNDYIGNTVIYPNSYNDENYVVRYFDFKFISSNQLSDINLINSYLNCNGDGVVFAVILENSKQNILENISAIDNNRIIFVVPKTDEEVSDIVYKYFAIKQIVAKQEDIVVRDELSYSLLDLENYIENIVEEYLLPEKDASDYFYLGKKKNIKRKSALSSALSSILEKVYVNYPIINNEMINKNIISSQAVNSRNKVLCGLLENEIKENLGLKGSGQEMSIMRSTVKNKGILVSVTDSYVLNTTNLDDKNLQNALNVIREFIISSTIKGGRPFIELYDLLTKPENGIGMKKGVIPIYIACVIHKYKKHIAILKGSKELELSARLLDSINENPTDFSIYIENWSSEKENYISYLSKVFSSFVKEAELEFSNFDYIVRAIQRWYLQLPKYSKEAKKIFDENGQLSSVDKSTLKFIGLIKSSEINAREFLFEKLLNAYGFDSFDSKLAIEIEKSKKILDNAKKNLISYLKKELISRFSANNNENASFSSVILNWYDDLNNETKHHMFNNVDSSLLEVIAQITPDEDSFVESFSRTATGLRIDDWAELTVDTFLSTVDSFIGTITEYNNNSSNGSASTNGSYMLSFTDESGNVTYKTFDKTNYTSVGSIMYSDVEAMIEEYGEAISKEEKRQILIDAINKLLG